MSDLQLGLLAVGVVVVGVVYLFNWLQERRLQQRMQQSFGAEHDDVLLQAEPSAAETGQRVEPLLQSREQQPEAATESAIPDAAETVTEMPAPPAWQQAPACFDDMIYFTGYLETQVPLSGALLGELLGGIAACGKPVRAAGFNAETGLWEDFEQVGSSYAALCLALQLVNRTGPVSAAQLSVFCNALKNCADKVSAPVALADTQDALKRAKELDTFCAEVDVAIGVNIVAPTGVQFSGTRIRALAEAAGFRLEPEGVFHYLDDTGQTLFTLDNHEPAPFIPEQIKSLSTGGITLLLDVPRVADGRGVLERMVEIAKDLSRSLGGKLVDDNRVLLNDAGIIKIRQQLGSIYDIMETHDIRAGSERALRLFS